MYHAEKMIIIKLAEVSLEGAEICKDIIKKYNLNIKVL